MSVLNAAKAYEVRSRRQSGTSLVQAVRDVTFDVYPGDNFGIVGESGCGKSSLMRLLTGLERPDGGTILFDGENVGEASAKRLRALRRRFQLVLQDPYGSLPPQSSIGDILTEPLKIHRIGSRSERRDRARAVMSEVGLNGSLFESLPTNLSAGQRQRLNVARAIILEPSLLIMDETLSALDQTEQGKLLDLFEKLQAQHGFTYIFISHDLTMVRRVCSRIAVMYLGETVEVAPNDQLFFNPVHPYTRALLSGGANAGRAALSARGLPDGRRAAEPDRPAAGLRLREPLPACLRTLHPREPSPSIQGGRRLRIVLPGGRRWRQSELGGGQKCLENQSFSRSTFNYCRT